MKLISLYVVFLFFINTLHIHSQTCTNPLLNYDIFDEIIFYDNATILTESLGMCNLSIGDSSCCSALNANDLGVIYDKFKSRIEDYGSDWILNYKNLLNPFLDLNSMGITTSVPNLLTDLQNVVLLYRTEIQQLNKLQSQCASSVIQMFSGTLCMVCQPNYSNYMNLSNPEQTNTSLSQYTIIYTKSNCDIIYQNCKDYLNSRANLENRIYYYMIKLIDTLTAYIGEMPTANMTLINSAFTNNSVTTDRNMTSRLLAENEENNEYEEDFTDLENYDNITSITSTFNLDRISRGLKSSGGRSGGGRSSGSSSSGRSSSSSSSSRSSSSSSSSGRTSSTTSSSSGSSSGRTTGTTTSSSGSSGGRSVYSSRTTYGARTATPTSTVKSSSTARSSFSRTTTTSIYRTSYYRTTYVSRTYSYSRSSYIIIYSSPYGYRYRTYYNRNTYGTNKKVTQVAKASGISYTIITADDYQGVLSPFFGATTLPVDIQVEEMLYHQAYINWLQQSSQNGVSLVENCPKNYAKCRVCVDNFGCSYYTKAMTDYYDKYCHKEIIGSNNAYICNICVDDSCDLEAVYQVPLNTGSSFPPITFTYYSNRFTTESSTANYKPPAEWDTVDDATAMASFKNNAKYSPRTRRVIPVDVALPDISIPPYTSPCSDSVSCETWMCNNFFDGIVPEASKLANPQDASRFPVTYFSNGTQQVVSFRFDNTTGFDAYNFGSQSGLNSTALIDNTNIWSSDTPDPL